MKEDLNTPVYKSGFLVKHTGTGLFGIVISTNSDGTLFVEFDGEKPRTVQPQFVTRVLRPGEVK